VVTPDEVGDPQALAIGLNVNGAPQQRSSTSEMIFPVAELIARLAAEMTLLPGDLVLTGTPHGTGGFQVPPQFLRPGDVIEAWIERIGTLVNTTGGPSCRRLEAAPPQEPVPHHQPGLSAHGPAPANPTDQRSTHPADGRLLDGEESSS
jgi:hypothetical protein